MRRDVQDADRPNLPPPGVVSFSLGFSRGLSLYIRRFASLVPVSLVFCAVQFGVAILQQIPLLGPLVAQAAAFIFTPVMNAGFSLAALKIYDGGWGKVSDLFVEFRALGQLVLLTLVQIGVIIAGLIPGCAIVAGGAVPLLAAKSEDANVDPETWQIALIYAGGFVFVLSGLVVVTGLLWCYSAFVDRRAGFWDAVKTSWALTRNNPAGSFGVLIVGLVAVVIPLLAVALFGMMALWVGIIFSLPIPAAVVAATYRSAQPRVGDRGPTGRRGRRGRPRRERNGPGVSA